MVYAAPVVVDGPVRRPLPYGLFSVLSPGAGPDSHWAAGGVEWEALGCSPASGFSLDCTPEDSPGIGAEGKAFAGQGTGDTIPFGVYGSFTCAPGGMDFDRAQDRATEHLLTREEFAVERILWTGSINGIDLGTKALLDGAVVIPGGGTSTFLADAVGRAEEFIATEYGSLGVLHMPRWAAVLGLADDVIVRVGSRLETVLGTPVVAGSGYPHTDSAGAPSAAGEASIIATPAMLAYRSEVVQVGAQFDRETNDYRAVAERMYLIGWDPCPVGIIEVKPATAGGN